MGVGRGGSGGVTSKHWKPEIELFLDSANLSTLSLGTCMPRESLYAAWERSALAPAVPLDSNPRFPRKTKVLHISGAWRSQEKAHMCISKQKPWDQKALILYRQALIPKLAAFTTFCMKAQCRA